jgi:hypothetical protein
MNFDEFETKARLYVLGAMEEEELAAFEQARAQFGAEGDAVIRECERLNSLFALSLRPIPPQPATKQRLLSMIEKALGASSKVHKDGGINGN